MGRDSSFIDTWRERVYSCLAPHERDSRAHAVVTGALIAAIAAGVAGSVLGTLPDLTAFQRQASNYSVGAAFAVFAIEYLCRIWTAPETDPAAQADPWRARWSYLRSFLGVVDLLVILPPCLGLVFPLGQDLTRLAVLFALLKSARYAKSLPLFAAVFRNEGRALLSGLMVMMVLMVLVSGVMFALERGAQPDVFRSIPHAMWWAMVTMATVGYGDITPITPLGKLFGGFTMLLGIAMFAVPAGILANGFAAEIRRRDFVVTWHTVAGVPLFASLDATRIAGIAWLLKTQVVPARQVVVRRGEPADAMFFIMSGEVEVDVLPHPVRLGKGQYFGEIALIKDTVRNATVTTVDECQLLSLDVNDFRRLMTQHPDLKEAVERVAEARLRQDSSDTSKPEGSS
jgi:voltage-gated potassium channel